MKKPIITTIFIGLFAVCAFAQSTEFTYQGRLLDNSLPPTANYDFEFSLWDALVAGNQQGTTQTVTGVAVANGIFTVKLNFGAQFTGAARFIQIAVRPSSGGAYTTLAPRQPITSAPHAIKSLTADIATTATNATTANDALNLGGVAASQFVQTNDPRMTNARDPLPNSSNYIQNNPLAQQTSSSFNISGNGTAGGTLTANVVTATQFNTGAARVFKYEFATGNTYAGFLGNPAQSGTDNSFFGNLAGLGNTGSRNSFFGSSAARLSNTGSENSFFGASSGQNNTGGQFNSFFGSLSGVFNQTGNFNSFFGFSSGVANTLGTGNAFFGSNAGRGNTEGIRNTFIGNSAGFNSTLGQLNTFVGDNVGLTNTIGSSNTLLGSLTDVGSNDLSFATAIGAGATVNQNNYIVLGRSLGQDTVAIPGNTQMLGNLSVSGTLTGNGSGLSNLNASNITSGTLAIANGGTGLSTPGSAGNYLRSSGTIWTSSALQASDIPAGSPNYIQNTTTQQTSSNFNINGDGTIGGTLRVVGTGILGDPPTLLALPSGKVGIGTEVPTYPLTVDGSAGSFAGQAAAEFSNGVNDTGVRIRNTAANGRTWTLFSSGGTSGIGAGKFSVYDATAAQSRLLIDSAGNVGIGTTDPGGEKLYVAGNGRFAGNVRLDGALSLNGSQGQAGQVVTSNGSAATQWKSPTNLLYQGTTMSVDSASTTPPENLPLPIPGLNRTIITTSNAKLLIQFNVFLDKNCLLGCGISNAAVDLNVNGVRATRVRRTLPSYTANVFFEDFLGGSWVVSIGAGTHTIEVLGVFSGASVTFGGGGSFSRSNLIVQVIPE